MINHWKILDINPTRDIRQIKKAYAELLKSNDTKELPENFQLIREAYQAALDYAKQNELDSYFKVRSISLSYKPDSNLIPTINLHPKSASATKDIYITDKSDIQSVVASIFRLCDAKKENSAVEFFNNMLDSDQFYGIDPLYEFEGKLLIEFYNRNHPPIQLLLAVNQVFDWDQSSNPFKYDREYCYAFDKVIILIEGAKNNDKFHYDKLKFKYLFYSTYTDEQPYLWKYIEPVLYLEVNQAHLRNIYNVAATRQLFQHVIDFSTTRGNSFATPPVTQSVLEWWQEYTQNQNESSAKSDPKNTNDFIFDSSLFNIIIHSVIACLIIYVLAQFSLFLS